MVLISRFISLGLRTGQLISAVIVAGIVGHYLAVVDDAGLIPGDRFIYTEVVAGLAIFTSLILLIPMTWAMTPLPWDFIMFLLWIISFSLLTDYIAPRSCSWYATWAPVYTLGGSAEDECSTWKTSLAFIFISAMLWLASFFLGLWVVHRLKRSGAVATRRPWYRSNY